MGCRSGHTCACPQCLLRMSAGLIVPGIWLNEMMFAATASLVKWYAKPWWRFPRRECGMDPLLTITDLLSPKRNVFPFMGTPRYRSISHNPMICWIAVLAEVNSNPYVAVLTVTCFLVYQSTGGVLLMKCRIPVTALPVLKSWSRFVSLQHVNTTAFPFGSGMFSGACSLTFPYTACDQSHSLSGR